MTTTPYFTELQKLSLRTSKLRSQNNKLAHSLRYHGFSSCEINQITETECFVISRTSIKKKCNECGKEKPQYSFHKRAKGSSDGFFNQCKKCRKEKSKEYWIKNHKENPNLNKERESFKREKRKIILYSS